MNHEAVSQFVQAVTSFGPVRAKYLPRKGESMRLTDASVVSDEVTVTIQNEQASIMISLDQVEHIVYAREDQKYFVHMTDALVEVRPDRD